MAGRIIGHPRQFFRRDVSLQILLTYSNAVLITSGCCMVSSSRTVIPVYDINHIKTLPVLL